MTRFEEIGVDIQYSSHSKRDAEKSFKRSCDMCCDRGLRIDCERCAIANTHNRVVEGFNSEVKCQMVSLLLNMA